MKKSILLLFLSVLVYSLCAQNDSTATKSGEIIDGQIVIEKEKKITLPKANKVFKKAELRSFNTEPLQLSFEVVQPSFDWPDYKSDVPFQSVKKKYPIANSQNYVKLGFGNYASPLIGAGVFMEVGKMKLSSVLTHESFARGPINDDFSRFSNTAFDFSAKYTSEGFSVTPFIEVENQQYNFYGNTDRLNTGFSNDAPDEARFNKVTLGTVISGSKKGFKYYLNSRATSATQKLKNGLLINKEPFVKALAGAAIKIDTSFKAGFDIEAYSSNYESGISYNRSLFQFSPWVSYHKNDLSLKGGFRVASSDAINNSVSGFYPFADAELQFNPDWSVYGFVDGGFDWNSLDQHISQNQFLDDSLAIANTEKSLTIGGGINGTLFKNVEVSAEASYASMKNVGLYSPSLSDSSRFIIIYDNDKVEVVKFKLVANYSPNSISTYGANFELIGYTLTNIDKPWHLPTVRFSLNGTHNINQKVIFSTSIITLAGIEAPSNAPFGREKLPTIIDINVGVKYLITNKISMFIDTNNLLNNQYERYIGYPVRGVTFKIGGKYRF